MSESVIETLVGAAVLAAAGLFLVYAADTAQIRAGGGYEITAKFRKADGLDVGADVRVAGVKVGSVTEMAIDPATYYAAVHMAIDESIRLPEDSLAKITTAGLLGDAYVAIEPGASDEMLPPGGEIAYTQGAVLVGDLIGRMIQGGGQ